VHVVVYRASPGQPAEEAIGLLCAAGLSPSVVGPANPDHFILWAAKGRYRVEVAVPADQAARAVEVLAAREARSAPYVRRLTAQFRRHVICGALAVALAAAATFLLFPATRARPLTLDDVANYAIVALVGILVVTTVLGQVAERRRRRREGLGCRCESCGRSLMGLTESRCPECGRRFDVDLLPKLALRHVEASEDLTPSRRDRVRRVIGLLCCWLVFEWSFVPPWRPALEEPKTGDEGCEERDEKTWGASATHWPG